MKNLAQGILIQTALPTEKVRAKEKLSMKVVEMELTTCWRRRVSYWDHPFYFFYLEYLDTNWRKNRQILCDRVHSFPHYLVAIPCLSNAVATMIVTVNFSSLLFLLQFISEMFGLVHSVDFTNDSINIWSVRQCWEFCRRKLIQLNLNATNCNKTQT